MCFFEIFQGYTTYSHAGVKNVFKKFYYQLIIELPRILAPLKVLSTT